MLKKLSLAVVVALSFVGMSACGGGGGNTPPNQVFIDITTDVSNIQTFQTVNFTATVTGTSNQAVTWLLSCSAVGVPATVSVCGSIDANSGKYVAPNTVPTLSSEESTDPATLTVIATSAADPTASFATQFTINSTNLQPYQAPVPLGASTSNVGATCTTPAPGFCFGGTIGSLLSNGTNMFVMSNNHVLGLSDAATVGQDVTQPGEIETNCSTSGTINIANVSTVISLESPPIPATPVDVTIAQIINGQVDTTGKILELGPVVNGVPGAAAPVAGSGMAATVGELLAKSGRTTGLTCATVESINTNMIIVGYEKGCASSNSFNVTYNDEVVVQNMSNGQNFLGDGDSGSLAVDQGTAQPVALLFAGDDVSAVANPVSDVLASLKAAVSAHPTFTFVGGAQHTVDGCSLPGLTAVRATPQSATTVPGAVAQSGQAAASRNAAQIMNMQGVSAYGGGGSLDSPGEPAILIFSSSSGPHPGIPAEIDGVRTRIVETNDTTVRGAVSTTQGAQLAAKSAQTQAPEVAADAIESTKTVKEQHVTDLMSDPAVQGVGVSASLDSPGDPALIIYVMKGKAHRAIPATIDGVRTRVRETSGFRVNRGAAIHANGCRVRGNAQTGVAPAAAPVAAPAASAVITATAATR
jgi:hypothetical protein